MTPTSLATSTPASAAISAAVSGATPTATSAGAVARPAGPARRHIGAAALVLAVAGAGSACGSDAVTGDESERDDEGQVVEGGEVGALALQVGDCLAAEAIGDIESVPVVPCSEPHDSELFHRFDLAGDDYPGDDRVVELANDGCIEAFDAFIGLPYAESVWDITTIFPTELSWDAIGDREVLCGVFPLSDEDTTGSARGIAE